MSEEHYPTGTYDSSGQAIHRLSKSLAQNEGFKKTVTENGPSVAGGVVKHATGSDLAGQVTKAATEGIARSNPDGFTEVVATGAVIVTSVVASVVLTPVVLAEGVRAVLNNKKE